MLVNLETYCRVLETTHIVQTYHLSKNDNCGCALQVFEQFVGNLDPFDFKNISKLMLEINEAELQSKIVNWNDNEHLTFPEIADKIRQSVSLEKLNLTVSI